MPADRTRRRPWGFAAFVAGLLVLHVVDPWRGEGPITWLGLPWDLWYHLLWMAAAAVAVLHMTSSRVWPDEPEP